MWMMLVGAAISLLVCLCRTPVARSLSLLDSPDGLRKLHAKPVALMGGIAAISGLVVAQLTQMLVGGVDAVALALTWLAASLVVLGAADDRSHIQPALRLVLSSASIVPVALLAPGFLLSDVYFEHGFTTWHLGVLALPFTVICLLALQNAVNMSDGINGLAGSMAVGWCLLLSTVAPAGSPIFWVLAVLAACAAVSLVFNLAGKLFFGDAGAYAMSMVIGASAIWLHNQYPSDLPAEGLLLMFMIPVSDMTRLIVRRISSGRSPFVGDRNHLHHILVDRFGWARALTVYLGLVFVPATAGILFTSAIWLFMALGMLAYISVVASWQSSLGVATGTQTVQSEG